MNTHILIIPSWYPLSETSINGIFFKEQAHALKRAGYKVGVISPQMHFSIFSDRVIENCISGWEYKDDDGIPTYYSHNFTISSRVPFFYENSFVKAGLQLFRKYIVSHGLPNIVHAHSSFPAGVLCSHIKKEYNLPIVITEHRTTFAIGKIRAWQKPLIDKAFQDADKIIVVSPQLGNLLSNTYKSIKNFTWIPNMVDPTFTEGFLRTSKKTCEKFVFLNVAQLHPKKDHVNLLMAFEKAFKNNPNVELRIAGGGLLRSKLESIVKSLEIDSQVKFLGIISRQSVYSEMCTSNAFVLASKNETFGVVLIEALACGIPIVATASGGPECIVNDSNGVIVPIQNALLLSQAMLYIYQNINIFRPQSIKNECINIFGEKKIVGHISKIYNEVIREHAYSTAKKTST